MASDPARTVIWDETDKSKEWDGKESGVAELVDVRTATYENSLLFAMSTPTTADGPITNWSRTRPSGCGSMFPCPHCGHFQQIAFERIRYPRAVKYGGRRAAPTPRPDAFSRIPQETWDEIARSRTRTGARPRWSRRTGGVVRVREVRRGGHTRPPEAADACWPGTGAPKTAGTSSSLTDTKKGMAGGHRRGIDYPAWLSLAPKHRFYKIAAEWILCAGNERRTQGFRNSWQGQPFKIVTQKTVPDAIRSKKAGAPAPMQVPDWTRLLCATADVQGNDPATGYFYYLIRAWGYGYRSRLIDYGIVNTFDELHERAFNRPIPFEAGGLVAADHADRLGQPEERGLPVRPP
jgi:phage terminase large subunit GpA-like protein